MKDIDVEGTEYKSWVDFIALVAMPLGVWSEGFVIDKAWGWFVVDFFATKPLGTWRAAGLSMMVGLMASHFNREAKNLKESCQRLTSLLLKPWAFLLIAFLIKGCI